MKRPYFLRFTAAVAVMQLFLMPVALFAQDA
jgi:hypothetical protein